MNELIKKINQLSDEMIDDEMSELEISLELDEIMEINAKAIELMNDKTTCTMLRIPYHEADKSNNYRKLQLYAYYLNKKQEVTK